MATLAEVRKQYPQYDDMSDADLADAMHRKFYSDMPRNEFDAKIGFTLETQPKSRLTMDALMASPNVGTPENIYRQANTGPDVAGRRQAVVQGMTLGFGDEIAGGLAGLSSKLKGGDYMPAYEAERDRSRSEFSDYTERNPLSSAGMQAVGGLALGPAFGAMGRMMGPANTIAQAARHGATVGGTAGALYGYGSSEGGTGNRIAGAAKAGAAGAITGGATPYVYDGARRAGNWVRGRWEPNPIASNMLPAEPVTPETAALYNSAQQLGIPIRPGQIATSPAIKTADDTISRLPGAGFGANDPNRISNREQSRRFNRALAGTFGENADVISQQTMANAENRIGNMFNTALERNSVVHDSPLAADFNAIRANILDALDDQAARPVMTAIDRVQDKLAQSGGALTGRQYQTMRQRGGLIDAVVSNDNPTVSHYGRQLRDALDAAFERQSPQADAELLRTARSQWRNMKVVDPLSAKAPTGDISPALLLERVRREYPNFASQGAGEIGDLARIGQAFLKAPPNSGTAERSMFLNFAQHPIQTTARAALGIAGGRAMNETINSPAYLARLLGQPSPVTPPMVNAPQRAGITAELLAQLLRQSANEAN